VLKILYVLSHVQHPTMRGALRYYYFLHGLARHHAITLLVLAEREVTPQAQADWSARAERMLIFPIKSASSRRSIIAGSSNGVIGKLARRYQIATALRKMNKTFRNLIRQERFDVVLFSGKKVYPVIQGFSELPVVVDFCDATTLREGQRLSYVKGLELAQQLWRYAVAKRTQRKMLEQTPYLAFISPRDRDAVLEEKGAAVVIPNGIDLDYWRRTSSHRRANCIVFTGVMDYPPNEDAALFLIETVLPCLSLMGSLPELEVLIVGRDPSAALLRAGNKHGNVTITGYVEDMRPYLERATVFIAPIRFASGLQNKILEALAMEVPVVTTPIVAAGVRVDGHLEPPLKVADTADEFSGQVLSLLTDEQECSRLGAEGRRFVQAHFDWTHSADMLEALCRQAADQRSSGRNPETGVVHSR
jgi:polysaccharide biosynthesis protein PslH